MNTRKGKIKFKKTKNKQKKYLYTLPNSEFLKQNHPQSSFLEPTKLVLLQILGEKVDPAQVVHFTEDSEAQSGERTAQS